MAKIYRAPSENHQEVEAFIAEEIAKMEAFEEKEKKRRPIMLALYLLGIVLSVGAAAYVFLTPGVLEGLQNWAREALSQLADMVRFSYEDVENGDYSGEFGERILEAILGFFMIILRTVGALAIDFLVVLAPIAVAVGVVALAGLGVYLCSAGISETGWRSPTQEEYRSRAIWRMDGRMKSLLAGVEGEEKALEAVSVLDDAYSVFFNLDIKFDGGNNETDLIVVGPGGLTMVEVKNYSGTLLGDLSDEDLIQRKYRKNGKYSDDKRSNPVQQIEEPAARLEKYLKWKGLPSTVRRAALFIHEDVELQVTDRKQLAKRCPLFFIQDPVKLRMYLQPSRYHALTNEETDGIVAALRKFL